MNDKSVPAVAERRLVLEGDPQTQLAFAQEAAKALMGVIKPRKINGRDYLEFSGWQTVGRFYGGTVNVDWSRPIERGGKVVGYEARAVVLKADGSQFSSAEAQCTREERSWSRRDEFALRSMAQTRAGAKALRNAFGWVVELAGYASTPAEEMDEETGEIATPAPTPGLGYSISERVMSRAEPLISVDEAIELRRVLKEGDVDEAEFCKQAHIEKLEDLEQRRYLGAVGYYRKIKT